MKQLQHLATILFLLYQTGLCTPLHAQHMADSLRHMAEQLPHNAERCKIIPYKNPIREFMIYIAPFL